jgi:hypothetical protein
MQTGALEDEDLEAQVDRLNFVIARTLEEAQRAARESEHSHKPTEESLISYGHDLNDVLFSEPGYYSEAGYDAEDDFHDYVEALVLQTERFQMMLEDCRGEMMRDKVLVKD